MDLEGVECELAALKSRLEFRGRPALGVRHSQGRHRRAFVSPKGTPHAPTIAIRHPLHKRAQIATARSVDCTATTFQSNKDIYTQEHIRLKYSCQRALKQTTIHKKLFKGIARRVRH